MFCRNKREYSIFHSDNFGEVLYVEVGATSVGTVVQTFNPEKGVGRGAEKGYFKFGGSTVLLFFKRDKVLIDKEYLLEDAGTAEKYLDSGKHYGKIILKIK